MELKTTLRVGQERVFTPHTELVNVEKLRKTQVTQAVKPDLLKEQNFESAALANAGKCFVSGTRKREAAKAVVKGLTSELENASEQHDSPRVRMIDLERQCKVEKAQARVQQTQTSSGVPSANVELQLQPSQELLRPATVTDGLLSQTWTHGRIR